MSPIPAGHTFNDENGPWRLVSYCYQTEISEVGLRRWLRSHHLMDASTECSSRRSPELVGVFAVVQSLMLRFPLPSGSNVDLPWTCRGNLHTTTAGDWAIRVPRNSIEWNALGVAPWACLLVSPSRGFCVRLLARLSGNTFQGCVKISGLCNHSAFG